jgi:hypothetical protein
MVLEILQFEDEQDAEDAIRGRDGYNFDGHPIRVCCRTDNPDDLVGLDVWKRS